jgi:hypothetical protein
MRKGRSRRWGSWSVLVLATLTIGYQLSCIGVLQNEIEVMFAPWAGFTPYLIPFSTLYNVFGSVIWKVAAFLT